MDILATAIGKADHPGRVRGTPKGIGIKEFFGSASRRSTRSSSANMVSKEELDQRLQEETERVRAELSQQHMAEMQKIRDEFDAKFQQTLMMMGTSGFQMPRVSEPSQVIITHLFKSSKDSFDPFKLI